MLSNKLEVMFDGTSVTILLEQEVSTDQIEGFEVELSRVFKTIVREMKIASANDKPVHKKLLVDKLTHGADVLHLLDPNTVLDTLVSYHRIVKLDTNRVMSIYGIVPNLANYGFEQQNSFNHTFLSTGNEIGDIVRLYGIEYSARVCASFLDFTRNGMSADTVKLVKVLSTNNDSILIKAKIAGYTFEALLQKEWLETDERADNVTEVLTHAVQLLNLLFSNDSSNSLIINQPFLTTLFASLELRPEATAELILAIESSGLIVAKTKERNEYGLAFEYVCKNYRP